MSEQLRLIPGEDPDRLVQRARSSFRPIAAWCLFSGGNDSTVLAHRCRDHYDERQIEALLAESKAGHPRSAHVLFLSGIRRAESLRRAKREPITKKGGAVFVNPLIDWSNADMLRYRREHNIPESDAAALLHRSGECNCGAFADAAQERPMLEMAAPRLCARIRSLEDRAQAAGLRWCVWGGYDLDGNQAAGTEDDEPGLLCSDCSSRLFNPFAEADAA